MLKGIAASAGIANAKVYKLEHPELVIEKKDANKEEELKKFEDALTRTREDITTIQKNAVGKLSDEELAIFDAHLEFTNDPEFGGQINAMIESESVNAEYAVDEVSNMFIGIFEGMDDPYFRERAADIKDVSYRIKCHIMDVRIPDLTLIDEEVIIVAEDLTPSDTAQLNKEFTKGFATEIGGRTSHSAIMARSLEIPAIVGVKGILDTLEHDQTIIMDAIKGEIIMDPTPEQIEEYAVKENNFIKFRDSLKVLKDEDSITTDGHQVEIVGNIGTPNDAQAVIDNGGEGVGLYRTEFLYMDSQDFPTEEEQYNAYKAVLEQMPDQPVVVRTLDIGGDKELPYLDLPEEMNPFLGYRAIRLCLDRDEIFRVQLRALLRASVHGKLCIMFPMVATLEELRDAKQILKEEEEKLVAEGIEVSDDYQVGIMVEIPAVAVLSDKFAKEVDFFSIGTNDLIQYSMAADRMSEKVSYLYQPLNPSLLRLIKMTIDGAHKEGIWVGMCGEVAGDPQAIPILLGLGLDEFSMSATSILEARKIIRGMSLKDAQELASKAIECTTDKEVAKLVEEFNN